MEKPKLTESKKAMAGGIGIATILGLISQGLPVITAAYIVGAIVIAEIFAWAHQEGPK